MQLSARDHVRSGDTREAIKLLVVALIALIVAAPIASSWHDLTVRHVRCAEHGELTHVRASAGAVVAAVQRFAVAEGQDTGTPDGHEHCSSQCLRRARPRVSIVQSSVRFTPPPTVVREVREPSVIPGRAFVLASAPKTSPPSA